MEGKTTALWKGGPSGAEEKELESGARQQSSLLTSIGREVKMALANSGRKFSPEEVAELREQFNSVSASFNSLTSLIQHFNSVSSAFVLTFLPGVGCQ